MRGYLRCLVLAAGSFVLSGCGFTGNLRMDPGFASFGAPSMLGGVDREFGLSLGPVPLRLATMLSRPIFDAEDEWIPDTMKSVRAVRVYTYAFDADGNVREHIDQTRSKLLADGWDPIVVVREDGGLATALVMPGEPDVLRGLVVMFEEDAELVLVNLIGRFTSETLGHVMAGLDIEWPAMTIAEI